LVKKKFLQKNFVYQGFLTGIATYLNKTEQRYVGEEDNANLLI